MKQMLHTLRLLTDNPEENGSRHSCERGHQAEYAIQYSALFSSAAVFFSLSTLLKKLDSAISSPRVYTRPITCRDVDCVAGAWVLDILQLALVQHLRTSYFFHRIRPGRALVWWVASNWFESRYVCAFLSQHSARKNRLRASKQKSMKLEERRDE